MKILTISREELLEKTKEYKWLPTPGFTEWVQSRLTVAGFDMTQVIYRATDADGNRVYAQKEHEAEDIETAFQGHS